MLEGAALVSNFRDAGWSQVAISLSTTEALKEARQVLLHGCIGNIVSWAVDQVERDYSGENKVRSVGSISVRGVINDIFKLTYFQGKTKQDRVLSPLVGMCVKFNFPTG